MNLPVENIKFLSNLKNKQDIDLWYNRYISLLEYANKNDMGEYIHMHHILPKSMFPEYKDDENNLIKLSYRLHYLAHYILLRLTQDARMAIAFTNMNKSGVKRLNSKLFESVTLDITESFKLNPEICTPKNIYWSIDENGKRYRTSDETKKIKGSAPWQKGFNKINKESTKFMNLETKEIVYVDKDQPVPPTYYSSNGLYRNSIIYLYNNVYYFGYLTLPKEFTFRKNLNMDELKNTYIPTMDSPTGYKSKKVQPSRKKLIEDFGGKSYYEAGLRAWYLFDDDFKFDLTKTINNFDLKNKH